MPRVLPALLLSLALPGCVRYEFDHEFWLNVDGSGTVFVTGRPGLWAAFKKLPVGDDATALEAARALFERSGLRVQKTRVTHRGGRSYLFVAADFADASRLSGSAAFPDLRLSLRREGERLELEGAWARPPGAPDPPVTDREGLVAVRFHLPSKVYAHRGAADGLERGNIVSWREEVAVALAGSPLAFGATLDRRSILGSTVGLFAIAIGVALALLLAALALVIRAGRKPPAPTPS